MPHSLDQQIRKGLVAWLIAAVIASWVAPVGTSGDGAGALAQVFGARVAEAAATYGVGAGGDGKTLTSGFIGENVKDATDLVAVLVEEAAWKDGASYDGLSKQYKDLDEDDLQGRVKRYAEDVAKALPKTKVIIVPVGSAPENVLRVRDTLERLYLEDDPNDGSPTQLKGIVIVGEVPLPVVHQNGRYFVSLFPYTDFVDPAFSFSPKSASFEPSAGAANGGRPQPEVWHGVIRAPLGGVEGRKLLASFLDKNHLYHTGSPAFASFRKKILMADLVNEAKSLNTTLYPRYENFLRNMEDLVYKRFSAQWLTRLQKHFNGAIEQDLADIATDQKAAGLSDGASGATNGGNGGAATNLSMDVSSIPDAQTIQPIQQFHVSYPELIGSLIGTLTDFATGSGRWSEDDVDSVPELIAKKDSFSMEYLKLVNDAIEKRIDDAVMKIQKPMPLLRNVSVDGFVRFPYSDGSVKSYVVGDPMQNGIFGGALGAVKDLIGGFAGPRFLFINHSLLDGKNYQHALTPDILNGRSGAMFGGGVTGGIGGGLGGGGRSNQYVNGINFDDLSRAQQCSIYGGSQNTGAGAASGGSGTAGAGGANDSLSAVAQMVTFLRSLDVTTLNLGAASGGVKDANPLFRASLGVHTRALGGDEAKAASGGVYDYGVRVSPDTEAGAAAVFAPVGFSSHVGAVNGPVISESDTFQDGDILLDIDGKKIGSSRPLDSALSSYAKPQKVTVTFLRSGVKLPLVAEVSLVDGNSDALVAGCHGAAYQNQKDVLNGKSSEPRCFPRAATYPIADRGGTARVSDTANISDLTSALACNNLSPFPVFNQSVYGYLQTILDGGILKFLSVYIAKNTIKDYLARLRTEDPTKVSPYPAFTGHDPAKSVFLDASVAQQPLGGFGDAPFDLFKNLFSNYPAKSFSLADFLDHYGLYNQHDDNGNFYDTNGNGRQDQMAWIDFNHNGALDLWVDPKFTGGVDMNALSGPPDLKGGPYKGPYTGEFVGGDFGVDEPSEGSVGFAYQGNDAEAKWMQIQKDILLGGSGVNTYHSVRHKPTPREYRLHMDAMQAKLGGNFDVKKLNILYPDNACVVKGQCSAVSDLSETSQWESIAHDTSDAWLRFTPSVEKNISSLFFHKEPTAESFQAAFQNPGAGALPIDKPRFVSFMDGKNVIQKIIYPNGFAAGSFTDLFAQVQKTETEMIALSGGTLAAGFLTSVFDQSNKGDLSKSKVENAIAWRGMSLNDRHSAVLQEYLNPDIDAYADDHADGYEAMYLVSDGRPNAMQLRFSGDGHLEDHDPEYQALSAGEVVYGSGSVGAGGSTGTSGAADGGAGAGKSAGTSGGGSGGESGGASLKGGKEADQSAAGETDEAVELSKWFDALKKWVADTKNSFRTMYLSLSAPFSSNSNTFDEAFSNAPLATTLSINVSKKVIGLHDTATVTVTGLDASGKVADRDHATFVRYDASGFSGDISKARVVPSEDEMGEVSNGVHGVFLSEGKAVFQIIGGSVPQKISLTFYGSNGKTKFKAAPVSIGVTSLRLLIETSSAVIDGGGQGTSDVTVRIVDESGGVFDTNDDVSVALQGTLYPTDAVMRGDALKNITKDSAGSRAILHLQHGQGSFTVRSGSVSGEVALTASGGELSLPEASFPLRVLGGAPKRILIMSESDTLLSDDPQGSFVSVAVTDEKNFSVDDQPFTYTLEVTGGSISGLPPDSDTQTNGYQISTIGKPLGFWVMPASGSSSVILSASAPLNGENGGGGTVTAKKTFAVRGDMTLAMNTSTSVLPADGGSASIVSASVVDGGGHVVTNYNGRVAFTLDAPDVSFFGDVPTHFSNGKATLSVRAGRRAGAIHIRATGAGKLTADTPLFLQALAPSDIRVTSAPRFLAAESGVNGGAPSGEGIAGGGMNGGGTVLISLFDPSGNPSPFSGTVHVRVTKDTQVYGGLIAGSSVVSEGDVAVQKGNGAFLLRANERTGAVHLVLSSAGLRSAFLSIPTVGALGAGFLTGVQPHTLYASLRGGAFGDVTAQNYAAGSLLFNGTMEAASALTDADGNGGAGAAAGGTNGSATSASVSLNPYGRIDVLDGTFEVRGVPSVHGGPLTFSAESSLKGGVLGRVAIRKDGVPILLNGSGTGASGAMNGGGGGGGVFVQPVSARSDIRFVSTADGVAVQQGAREAGDLHTLALVNLHGGIEIMDDQVRLQITDTENRLAAWPEAMQVDILFHDEVIGRTVVAFDAVNSVAQVGAGIDVSSLTDGVWLLADSLGDGNVFQPSLTGYASSAPQGYVLVSSGGMASLDATSETKIGEGFGFGKKYMLLLAAGNIVGNAHLPYASANEIVLGDPTVRLAGDMSGATNGSATGFSQDVGRLIHAGSQTPAFILSLDVNGDGKKDVLYGNADGDISYVQYTGGENRFTDHGVLLRVKNGIMAAASGDIDGNGRDDLVVGTRDRCTANETCVDVYRNTDHGFVRENLTLDVPQQVTSLWLADMNLDGKLDLVAALTNGDVRLYYQKGEGGARFGGAGQTLASFGIDVDEQANLIGDVHINANGGDAGENADYPSLKGLSGFDGSSKKAVRLSGGTGGGVSGGDKNLRAGLDTGDSVRYTLTIHSQQDANLAVLYDSVPSWMGVDTSSVTCDSCGDDFAVSLAAPAGYGLALSGVHLSKGSTRIITYRATVGTAGAASLSSGTLPKIHLVVGTHLPGVPQSAGSADAFPDVLVQPEGNTTGNTVYLISDPSHSTKGGVVAYTAHAIGPNGEGGGAAAGGGAKGASAANTLGGDFLSAFGLSGGKPQEQIAGNALSLLQKENTKDSDNDGLPDYLDNFDFSSYSSYSKLADGLGTAAKKLVQKYRCAKGGCLPLPLNYAALVPGPINVNGTPVGTQPGLPAFGAVGSCYPIPVWPPCPYSPMNFRFYVSPTLTGQLAVAFCAGGAYPTAKCLAYNTGVSFIPESLCKAATKAYGDLVGKASSLGSGSGDTALIANSGRPVGGSDTGGFHSVSPLLGPYKVETNVATNVHVPGFPKALTEWLDKQTEEVLNKLADLPDLYVYYPSLSSIGSSVVPKIPSGKLSGYTKFLAYLNSVPLVSIEPKPLTIRVPALSPSQIEKFKNDYQSWGVDFGEEVKRLKSMYGCDKGPANPGMLNICQAISVKAGGITAKLEKNLQTLDRYKELPKKLLEYRMIEAKYAGQLINYLRTVSTFTGGYVRRQEKRLALWIEAIKKIRDIVASWQAVVNISLDYNKSCDKCKTERYSLFQMLVKMFVNIPSPPIIEFPKWPDIVMDFSQVKTGVHVAWPDVTFAPQQLLLPNIPRVRFPIAVPQVNLNVDKLFDLGSYGASIPDLPAPPNFPNLPDLPALPVFKLPDLPPPPKIPKLGISNGINIQKHIDIVKKILKIVCYLKNGYIPVDESTLKTQVEELTQRALTPPLSLDLSESVSYPPVKYSAVDQFILKSTTRFELQTDVIYHFFKQFADRLNDMTTDMVRGANKASSKASKTVQGTIDNAANKGQEKMQNIQQDIQKKNSDAQKAINTKTGKTGAMRDSDDGDGRDGRDGRVRMVAKVEYIDPSYFEGGGDGMDGETFGDTPSLRLARALERYAAAPPLTRTLSRYVAEAGVSDTGSVVRIAYTGGGNNKGDFGGAFDTPAGQDASSAYDAFASSPDTAAPAGLFIGNPATGKMEPLVAYTREMDNSPQELAVDSDGDGDNDVVYSFGGDIYFKENRLKETSDAFTKILGESPKVYDLSVIAPSGGAPFGIVADDSQASSVSVSFHVPPAGSPVGYELLLMRDGSLSRRRYLFESASGKIPFDPDIPTEKLSPSETGDENNGNNAGTLALSLALPNGNTYVQIVALFPDGSRSAPSPVTLLAPQVCQSVTERTFSPFSAGGVNTPLDQRVSIGKTLTLNLSGLFDPTAQTLNYFADMDLATDSDHDGNPANDSDIQSGKTPSLVLGPFKTEGDQTIALYQQSVSGATVRHDVLVHVFVPEITLSSVSARDGTASGFVTPGEPAIPFALVRNRAGSRSVIAESQTDSEGRFTVSGLSFEGKTVLKNAAQETVAEFHPDTGRFVHLKSGYKISVSDSHPSHLLLITVSDATGTTLMSTFIVPDGNTDASVDPIGTDFAAADISSVLDTFRGVHVSDLDSNDTIEMHAIPANDPQFFGGVEIVDRATRKRLGVFDASGHFYPLDPSLHVRLRENLSESLPLIFDLTYSGRVIGDVFFATVLGKPLTLIDSAEFAPGAAPAFGGNAGAGDAGVPSSVPASIFQDISTQSPLYEPIKNLFDRGIIQGYDAGGASATGGAGGASGAKVFKPDQTITRAEFTKIVLKSLCIEPRAEAYLAPSAFNDVPFRSPLDWFYPYVKESFLRNLITGYLGERDTSGRAPFKPLATITRAEAVKIVIEALRILQILHIAPVTPDTTRPWYAPFLTLAQDLSLYLSRPGDTKQHFILSHDEAQYPNLALTRGDFAVIADRVLKSYDCYATDIAAKKSAETQAQKTAQDAAAKAQKAQQDALQKAQQDAAKKSAQAFAEHISSLTGVTSKLAPGVYGFLPPCATCPCTATLDTTGSLLPGDILFAILSNTEHTVIYRKSNPVTVSSP